MRLLKGSFLFLLLVFLVSPTFALRTVEKTDSSAIVTSECVKHLQWTRNATIYEVNIRQYTPQGTFRAFASHLPRLHQMGVNILWIMPINPISMKNRKLPLGSYYSVADYCKVNPEFGSMDDFKDLVKRAHALGMKVIVDWVANHTGWDNPWIVSHPDWYTHNAKGEIVSPVPDWTDTADLNYDNPDMRREMILSMKFWIDEANIDGFRCDMAGMVPVDFWNQVRKQLDQVKPVFMLAEASEAPLLYRAFDMDYSWELHHLMNDLAQGKLQPTALDSYFQKVKKTYPSDSYLMNFISNHDENSWNGTEFERMGPAVPLFSVLTFTVPGMPMLYSGQEASLNHRLKFFEKDEISWKDLSMQKFYHRLILLHKNNPALWVGNQGGKMNILTTSNPKQVFAFSREKKGNRVIVLLNISKEPAITRIPQVKIFTGKDFFTGKPFSLNAGRKISLPPWGYVVLVY